MPLDITALYAGLLALWIFALAGLVGQARMRHKVGVGDGGVPELLHKIRAHGNAVETIPIGLIVIGVAESFATPAFVVHLMGITLVVGRVIHGLYFLQGAGNFALRGIGIGLTMLVIGLGGLGLVGHGLQNLLFGAGL